MTDHALLSASSAARWMNCPGSVHMASLFPESNSSAAREGTLAHALAEMRIAGSEPNEAFKAEVAEFYAKHKDTPGSFDEMWRELDPYVDYVNALHQRTLKADPSAIILTEQRVDFSEYVPGGFGTADVVIIGADSVTIIDLKYGKGVPVSAIGNPQIRLYAIGAVEAFDLVYDFSKVRMVIYQPRLDKVTEEVLTVEELTAWALFEAKPAALAAVSENPTYHPGDWCSSHFCPGAGVCKARADYALALERHSGKDPALMTDEELSDALSRAEVLQKWVKELSKYALSEALEGHAIPGWKVVEGRSNRAFTDEAKVVEAAINAGYARALLYKSSLIGITDMERLMGRKNFASVLGGLVTKPAGAPKLAPESDARPALTSKQNIRNEFD